MTITLASWLPDAFVAHGGPALDAVLEEATKRIQKEAEALSPGHLFDEQPDSLLQLAAITGFTSLVEARLEGPGPIPDPKALRECLLCALRGSVPHPAIWLRALLGTELIEWAVLDQEPAPDPRIPGRYRAVVQLSSGSPETAREAAHQILREFARADLRFEPVDIHIKETS